jgi:microcystin-dependent protein
MKKFWKQILGIITAGFLFPTSAPATITCTLPFTLTNGTIADATQVMSNYNALVTCFTLAASAGVNNDITSLIGLSTPLAPTFGGTPNFIGGTSTGSANAQVVASVTPSNFSLTTGYKVTFFCGFTNTGNTQLNIGGTGLKNLFRKTQLGVSLSVGGECITNQPMTVVYDGTEYVYDAPMKIVGEMKDFGGSTSPPGCTFANGASVLRSGDVFTDLFSVYSTTYGSVDGSHFTLPDFRARMAVYQDNMGGAGVTNRISAAAGNFDATVLGTGAGSQTHTQVVAELAQHAHAVFLTDPGHTHTYNQPASTFSAVNAAGISVPAASGTTTGSSVTGMSIGSSPGVGNNSTQVAGSNTAMPIVNPAQVITKIVCY